jgi:hypothetical protein
VLPVGKGLGHGEEVVEMPLACARLRAGLRELAQRVLPDRLEHPEAGLPCGVGQVEDETGVEERLETARRIATVNGLHCVKRNESGEDSECAEHVSGVVLEEVVAPVDRGTERALAGREVRGVPGEQREALAQSLRRAVRSEHADARSRELDRQRKPVERSADPRDRGCVVVPELEGRDRRAHSFDVETDRSGVANGRRRSCILIRDAERRYSVLVLDRQP